MTELDHTHEASVKSWLASANEVGTDFPIQNLPFAAFRRAGTGEAFRGGVAIGDQIVDMTVLAQSGVLEGLAQEAANACSQPRLNEFFQMGRPAWRALRYGLFDLLRGGVPEQVRKRVTDSLLPMADAQYTLPAHIQDYTDFYTSLHHATNLGKLLRPDSPLSPAFKWIPMGYHGRVSSIGMSGQKVRRPVGQSLPAGAKEPVLGPCARLDYELELGIFIGTGNEQGSSIPLAQAQDHVFGLCLLNDWSARDIQSWESQPLGPFLAKSFATTLSPWIVTMEALAPFTQAWERSANDPQPLSYLDHPRNRASGAIDVRLEVWLQTARRGSEGKRPQRISATSFRHQYWTAGQMVAHHTVGGCNLQSGDLLGSGTISGPGAAEAGALSELSEGGRKPVVLDNGEARAFLEDGDSVSFRGWCEKPGFARIGFGENSGQVLPAISGDFTAR